MQPESLVFACSRQTSKLAIVEELAGRRQSVRPVSSARELLNAAAAHTANLIILAAGADGNEAALAMLSELRRAEARCPIVLVASNSSEELAIAAFRTGVTDVLNESASIAETAACLDRIGVPVHSPATDRMSGEGEAMRRARADIERAASTDLNVLITGETGTGKELAAERIHRLSRRRDHPFVSINCAAIPSGLLESELFGHERGAFTGALTARDGKLPFARGGTVFLDEIGDMDLYAQAKILRAVENRQVQRVGGHRDIPLDIRIIAATNQNLEERASRGEFRLDLYFRLNVVRIHLAPLRDRPEDLPALVDHILGELNGASGRAAVTIDAALVERLAAYSWPGNVRELRNVIETAFAFCTSRSITAADLPPQIAEKMRVPFDREGAERDRVLHALTSAHWNKSEAAKILHWSRMTLYRKMSRHGIDPARECNTRNAAATR